MQCVVVVFAYNDGDRVTVKGFPGCDALAVLLHLMNTVVPTSRDYYNHNEVTHEDAVDWD